MILDVPLSFKARVLRPGRRKPEEVDLLDVAAIEIQETAAADAPVAFWWSERGHGRQVAVRAHGGALYRPYCWSPYASPPKDAAPLRDPGVATRPNPAQGDDPWHDGYEKPSRPISADDLAARLARGAVELGPLPRERPPAHGQRLEHIGPIRSLESPLEALRSSLQSEAAELLAVDGALYVKAGTPLLVVEHGYGRAELLALWDDDSRVRPETAWPVSEWEDAAAVQRRLAGDDSPDDPAEDPLLTKRAPRPDIVRPDLLPAFDVGETVVRGAARAVLDRLEAPWDSGFGERKGAPQATRYGRAVLRAYAGLRDALADGASPDALLSRLADVSEAATPHGTLHDVQERIALLSERVGEARHDDEDAFAAIGPLA